MRFVRATLSSEITGVVMLPNRSVPPCTVIPVLDGISGLIFFQFSDGSSGKPRHEPLVLAATRRSKEQV